MITKEDLDRLREQLVEDPRQVFITNETFQLLFSVITVWRPDLKQESEALIDELQALSKLEPPVAFNDRRVLVLMGKYSEVIDQIRTNTAYPNYRRFVGIVAILGYVLAGLLVLITLLAFIEAVSVGEYREGFTFLVGSVIVAIIIVFVSRLLKEVALIFSDIADSITDVNSKTSSGQ